VGRRESSTKGAYSEEMCENLKIQGIGSPLETYPEEGAQEKGSRAGQKQKARKKTQGRKKRGQWPVYSRDGGGRGSDLAVKRKEKFFNKKKYVHVDPTPNLPARSQGLVLKPVFLGTDWILKFR